MPAVAEVLELLLLDRTNPRSLAYQLDRLQESLAPIPLAGRAPDQRDHLLSDVVDLLAEVDPVAVAAAVTDDGRRARLAETLESMLWRLHSAADEIERVHFVRARPRAARSRTPGTPGTVVASEPHLRPGAPHHVRRTRTW